MPLAYLSLENGMVFKGESFGAQGDMAGEIVFATGMTGYLETLTDPSYYGQIVLQTFPLIGNYGIIPADFEGGMIGAAAYIVKHPCHEPSNFRSEGNLDTFMRRKGIVGLCGIDTRALTKIIRESGVMNGMITSDKPCDTNIDIIRSYHIHNPVKRVSSTERKLYTCEHPRYTVALLDFGMKRSIVEELLRRGCNVWVLPCDTTPNDLMRVSPDGIMLSNGPGDPAENHTIIENIKALLKVKVPLFGICLGHQLLALASGFSTSKLKYGHRGANQPVQDKQTGRVYITSQNHGYAVLQSSIDSAIADEWFANGNDGTCEGLIYKTVPACSVQFHPEACAGPHDTRFLFERFVNSMEVKKNAAR